MSTINSQPPPAPHTTRVWHKKTRRGFALRDVNLGEKKKKPAPVENEKELVSDVYLADWIRLALQERVGL